MNHLYVFCRDKVFNDPVFKFELFLENSSSFLKILNFSCILLLKFTILIFQIFKTFYLLFNLKALVLIFFLQTFINLVHFINRIFFFLKVFLNFPLNLSLLLNLFHFSFQFVSLLDSSFFFLFAS